MKLNSITKTINVPTFHFATQTTTHISYCFPIYLWLNQNKSSILYNQYCVWVKESNISYAEITDNKIFKFMNKSVFEISIFLYWWNLCIFKICVCNSPLYFIVVHKTWVNILSNKSVIAVWLFCFEYKLVWNIKSLVGIGLISDLIMCFLEQLFEVMMSHYIE